MMSIRARRELLEAIATRYTRATRLEKARILDELGQVTGYRRHEGPATHAALRAPCAPSPRHMSFFQPILKLMIKEHLGGKVRKRYGTAMRRQMLICGDCRPPRDPRTSRVPAPWRISKR